MIFGLIIQNGGLGSSNNALYVSQQLITKAKVSYKNCWNVFTKKFNFFGIGSKNSCK